MNMHCNIVFCGLTYHCLLSLLQNPGTGYLCYVDAGILSAAATVFKIEAKSHFLGTMKMCTHLLCL